MIVRRALLVLCLVLLPVSAFAVVGADMGVTASHSPDPVAPDGNITYTVHVTNAGPSTATTAHFSAILGGTLLFQSITVPSGWTCPAIAVGSGGSFTCTAATVGDLLFDLAHQFLMGDRVEISLNVHGIRARRVCESS